MTLNVGKEVAALERLTVGELRERYTKLFAETTQARNRLWLLRRIVRRVQSLAAGGLSEQARLRAGGPVRLPPPCREWMREPNEPADPPPRTRVSLVGRAPTGHAPMGRVLAPPGPARPWGVPLAGRAASFSSREGMMESTGPKIFSCPMVLAGLTRANPVGLT